ncbi:MAG: aminopeptidase P family protein [Parvularculaceae bacterium]|nr:aminopeptidase P family protein [Parvularculaceae bacterium]
MLLDSRLNKPIPTEELQRRWKATRAAMKERGIDVLVMQANNDFMGGYIKWFTDIPATQGYTEILTFPADDGMTMISQGPDDLDQRVPEQGDGVRRGIARIMTAPMYASAGFTHLYDADLTIKALAPFKDGCIGLVGLSTLSSHLVDSLRKQFSGAEFVDASDLVDCIKAVKSPIEIEVIRGVAHMQDEAMKAAFDAFEPGKLDRDITAAAEYKSLRMGSEQGLYMCASSPIGTPQFFRNRHFQNRQVQPGDQMAILIENSGAGGYYCEIGRTATLGRATDEMHKELDFVLQARAFMLERLRPGASAPDIWKEYNDFMDSHGKPKEDRLHCHSMGYDMVERPLIRIDEPMKLEANMVVSCHPTYANENGMHWLCDNYLIGANATERLHAYPEEITEIL